MYQLVFQKFSDYKAISIYCINNSIFNLHFDEL